MFKQQGWGKRSIKKSESSAKKLKKQSSSHCDSLDCIPAPPTLTQMYDRDLDDNDRSVMQSRVHTCSFFTSNMLESVGNEQGDALVVEARIILLENVQTILIETLLLQHPHNF
ncbi:hypothetical protein V6N11_065238 [Hibiscus sabdariffa]|uniref:Uncharacterized protein n=2 Tax=Hibiscus sabdariffa TaxID=183260 RepID=A0ABR2BU83_9ROSI